MRQHTAHLGVVLLEDRAVPALIGLDQLQTDTSNYDDGHVLVQFRRGTAPPTLVSTGAENLGNGTYRVSLRNHVDVETAVDYFTGRSDVSFAQPDYRVTISRTPNDPSFGTLWGLNNTGQSSGTANADINAPESWNTTTGTRNTIVAVIDTGVDYRHPDLAANIWVNTREIAGNGKDDDGNGYRDDVNGWDFANNDNNPMDDNGHGTHVAGTIGAVGNNGIGVTGVLWNTRIMPLKFLDANGSGYMSNAVRAVNYAVANGAKVINNSYGGGGSDSAMIAALTNARNKGVIFVAAAGNEATNNDSSPSYPANYAGDNIVSVAATDRNDRLASFSNYGRTTVDIAAPGASIYSTLPNSKYGTFSGTSMATPHVAGAMALVWDANPTWTYKQVIQAVLGSADRTSALSGKVVTGRLNVLKALQSSGVTTPTDSVGARITETVFSGTNNGISRARVTFNEAIQPSTFTAADITLKSPAGKTIAISGVAVVSGSGNTQFDVTFANQTAVGSYALTVGTQVLDLAGNPLDQNANGKNGETTDRYTLSTSLTSGPKTYTATNVNRAIPDQSQLVSTITISDDRTISDLNVQLAIDHTYTQDLEITLVAPDGTRVTLFRRRGGSSDNLNNTIFDDEATSSIWQAASPFAGTFRPEDQLKAFDGKNAKGTWQLIVADGAKYDTGTLKSWSIRVG